MIAQESVAKVSHVYVSALAWYFSCSLDVVCIERVIIQGKMTTASLCRGDIHKLYFINTLRHVKGLGPVVMCIPYNCNCSERFHEGTKIILNNQHYENLVRATMHCITINLIQEDIRH